MSNYRLGAALLAALPLVSVAAAVDASAVIRKAVQKTAVPATKFSWHNRDIVEAGPHERGAWATVGGYYADYKGRKLETREFTIGADITPNIGVWYARQNFLVKGRQATSRFHLDADTYGIRWVVKPGETATDPSLAVQFETVRPSEARARAGNSSATFNPTKNNSFAVHYGPWHGLQAQLSYGSVKGAATGDASVYGLTVGKDFAYHDRLNFRLQGSLFGQSYTDVVEHVSFEVKPVLLAAAGYDLSSMFRLEGDATLLPSGMPLSSGRFTGLSSFQIYRPGGVAEGLRRDTIGFVSLRLMFHKAF